MNENNLMVLLITVGNILKFANTMRMYGNFYQSKCQISFRYIHDVITHHAFDGCLPSVDYQLPPVVYIQSA